MVLHAELWKIMWPWRKGGALYFGGEIRKKYKVSSLKSLEGALAPGDAAKKTTELEFLSELV